MRLASYLICAVTLLLPQHMMSKPKIVPPPVFGPVEIGDPVSKMPRDRRPLDGAPAIPSDAACGESKDSGFITTCKYQDKDGYIYITDGRIISSVSLSRPFLNANVRLPFGLSLNQTCQLAERQLAASVRTKIYKAQPTPATGNCETGAEIGPSPKSGENRVFVIDFDKKGRMETITVSYSLPFD